MVSPWILFAKVLSAGGYPPSTASAETVVWQSVRKLTRQVLLPAESERNSGAATAAALAAKKPKWAVASVLRALTPGPRLPSHHYCRLCRLDRTCGTPLNILLSFSSSRSRHCSRDKFCSALLAFTTQLCTACACGTLSHTGLL